MAASSYDAIPDFGVLYDAVPLYAARQDVGFYVEEAKRARGTVLEVGCGTGRILLPIARAGCSIVGVDSSRQMLERCRAKLAGELGAAPLEHLAGAVHSDDRAAGARDWEQDAAGAAANLEHRAARAFRLLHVEADVLPRRVQRHGVVQHAKIGNRVVGGSCH